MSKIFETLSFKKPGYSNFDLSHEKKLSCNMGDLIPVYLQDVVPGDRFKVKTETMIRLSPLIAPIMHRVNVYVHYFFVPNRIIWNQWEEFITGGQDGTSEPVFPVAGFNDGLAGNGSLADYLGVPRPWGDEASPTEFSQLPFRGYREIWNEYYRDENLQDPIDVHSAPLAIYQMAQRCWEKDYFTSALPWPQRGPNTAVPITFNPQQNEAATVYDVSQDPPVPFDTAGNVEHTAAGILIGEDTGLDTHANIDNTNAMDITVNDLRESTALQRWLETNARGGYRYVEQLLSHFNIKSDDARVQRPEYLGGGRQPVVISEVLNTSATATEPQGNMSGHGISVGTTNNFNKRFKEHGYVFGIMSILPRTAYQQGIPRHWLKQDKHDFYFPEFANLGEQAIENREIYWNRSDGTGSNPPAPTDELGTFGYQQRFAEYKYGCSSVHGDFRESLDYWHMGRIFTSVPALNEAFVESDPTDRIFAVQDGTDSLWVQIYNDVKARRPMPYHARPSLI